MFKRMFFLSGIIAFILAILTMWFWYLPTQEKKSTIETEAAPPDSLNTETVVP